MPVPYSEPTRTSEVLPVSLFRASLMFYGGSCSFFVEASSANNAIFPSFSPLKAVSNNLAVFLYHIELRSEDQSFQTALELGLR